MTYPLLLGLHYLGLKSDKIRTTLIYVLLLEEGSPAVLGTQAIEIEKGKYQLLPTPDYDPEDTIWEFLPGSIVKCVEYHDEEDNETMLIASEKIDELKMRHYDYVGLIEKFLAKEITVQEFEQTYLDEFKAETVPIGGRKFELLDWLFAEVDAYTDLPIEPDEDASQFIDEEQLRESAAEVLQKLRGLEAEN